MMRRNGRFFFRNTILGVTATAAFLVLGVTESSFAGRALRVKPIPAQIARDPLDPCASYDKLSPECAQALSLLAPAAGKRQYEVYEVEMGQNAGRAGDTTKGGSGGGGGSSGNGSGGSDTSSGASSGGASSGTSSGSSSGESSSSGGSTSSSSGSSGGNGKHPNSGRGNGSELDAHGIDQDPGNSGGHNEGGD